MKCITIRNPWAWAIIFAGKDVENRSWPTRVRGRVAVHVSASMTRDDYRFAVEFIAGIAPQLQVPGFADMQPLLGHIIGTVEVVDSVRTSTSPWYMGDHAHVLARPVPCTPIPYKGRLGYFEIPADLLPNADTKGCNR